MGRKHTQNTGIIIDPVRIIRIPVVLFFTVCDEVSSDEKKRIRAERPGALPTRTASRKRDETVFLISRYIRVSALRW